METDEYYLASVYPNLPYFSLPLYPSGHGGYNQILRKVFFLGHNGPLKIILIGIKNIKLVTTDFANEQPIKVEYYQKFRMI